jgi:hypothetical protein
MNMARKEDLKPNKIKDKDLVGEEAHEIEPEKADPEEVEIVELLTKPHKQKKIEKKDIDDILIEEEIRRSQNNDDWF